ncbi:MAG: hypothetical protein ABJF23_26180 [Bryobacteraceae bacterium]
MEKRQAAFYFALGLTGAMAAFGQSPGVIRQGSYWMQTSMGTVAAPASGKVVVKTQGGVVVRGGTGSQVSYVLRTRVQAASEAEAMRQLRAVSLRVANRASALELDLVRPSRNEGLADLEIHAPGKLGNIRVLTQDGNVEVYDIEGSVHAESGGGLIQMDRIGGDAVARTGGGEIRLGRIGGGARCVSGGGSISVDRCGSESWFETAGGEIVIRETGGPVHASTAGGSIRVDRAASTVSAHTAAGRIDVAHAGGIVTADNSGGSIQVGAAAGVRVESSGGTIRLRGSSGALRAVTDVGSILAELMSGMPLQNSLLSTSTGDITVFIPSNLALTVKARSVSSRAGRIVSEFPEIPVRMINLPNPPSAMAEGALNGGGPLLQISAATGTIYLRRQR